MGPRGVDRTLGVVIVFQGDVVDGFLAVELYGDVRADHADVHAVPLADGFVGDDRRESLVFLVVPECAGAFVAAVLLLSRVGRIPDLDLGDAAEVDAAVAVFADFPIDPHFEIAVVARGGEEGVLAVADEDAVFDFPMFVDAFFHFVVAGGAFFLGHRGDFFRVFGGAGPVFDVVAVEEGFEAFGGLVVFLSAGGGWCERDLEKGEERKDAKPQAGGERDHGLHLEGVDFQPLFGGAGKF